jgi:hypothetical protein
MCSPPLINTFMAKNDHASKLKTKNLIKKCLSQRRFSRSKLSFTKTILNESIFQINIIRVMFGPKTLKKKKKKNFLATLACFYILNSS